MYKCDSCKKVSNPGDKCFKVPFETRKKIYEHPDREPTHGYETVSEQSICSACYETYLKIYQEKERIEKEQQEQRVKEQALQNIRTPIIVPRLVRIPANKFNNRRRRYESR